MITNKFKPRAKSLKNTFCVFEEVALDVLSGLQPDFESESGSTYFYSENGMYRLSNHWGRLANSKWRLIAMEPESKSKAKLGFAKWSNFYPDNNVEDLYYLEADFQKKVVTYQHKNNPNYDGVIPLRTTAETVKRIRQIRNLFELTNWSKYYESKNIDELRFLIVNELVNTKKTLEEIKQNI